MFTNRLRQLNRYREIVSLFAKYGFGFLIEEIGLTQLLSARERDKPNLTEDNIKAVGNRVRILLEELGPTFIKMGQLLSIRSDFLPVEIILELEKLQDRVPEIPVSEIKALIKKELGASPEELFAVFDDQCVAAASIGQVHSAVLKTGENVMVKVQRPGIKKIVLTDIEILKDLVSLIEKRYKWIAEHHLSEVVNELSESIVKELDYLEEARNTETIQLQFEDHQQIKVPAIYWDFTTAKVLTMEKIAGVKITDKAICSLPHERKEQIANLLVESFVKQIFIEGFFHADPHPGNLLFNLDANQLGLIDFGQVGKLPTKMKYDATTLLIGLMRDDTDAIVKAIYKLAYVPPSIDERHFYLDIDRMRKKFSHLSIGELDLGYAIQEVFAIAQKHKIVIDSELTMTGKTLVTIEGIMKEIDPNIHLLTLAQPYGEQLFLERYNPTNMRKRVLESASDLSATLTHLPKSLEKLLDQAVEGNVQMEVRIIEMKELLKKVEQKSNQITLALLLIAFSILLVGLTFMTASVDSTFITALPIVEIGFILVLFLWISILYLMFKTRK